MNRTRGKASLDTIQVLPDGKLFGGRTVQWSLKNLEKLTHGSPITHAISNTISFSSLYVHCPSETKCLEEGIRPDVYFHLRKVSAVEEDPTNYVFLFAVAQDLPDADSAFPISKSLVELLRPSAVVEIDTPWVIAKTSDGFLHKLEVLRYFFKKDWKWSSKPSLDMFELEGSNFKIRSFNVQN